MLPIRISWFVQFVKSTDVSTRKPSKPIAELPLNQKTDPNVSQQQNKVENKKNIKITNGCT